MRSALFCAYARNGVFVDMILSGEADKSRKGRAGVAGNVLFPVFGCLCGLSLSGPIIKH